MSYQFGLGSLLRTPPKRRCFISYHHADEQAVRNFIQVFSVAGEIFSHRALGLEMEPDIVNSHDTDYVMRRIRERYMADTSVTIVMLGQSTWKRRYVDWEIAASLRNAPNAPANGLLGVHLPGFSRDLHQYPSRFDANLTPLGSAQVDCYARWIDYPANDFVLTEAIEAAFQRRRTHAHWIANSAPRFAYNRQ
ncbi:MAG: TIR domain-containing protein [Burkholderiales bacterium]|nr:TIR domain-containing protein [Burkholderiales bacterium]